MVRRDVPSFRIRKRVIVLMPLHKLDYYDENAIPPELRTQA